MATILDCYTDEPAGLGVPPYLGVYPRYIAGKLVLEGEQVDYLTIDDARLCLRYQGIVKRKQQTDIRIHNLTRSFDETKRIIQGTRELIVICGAHVPGKYLSAIPGTLHEITGMINDLQCTKILTGPAATHFGTRLEGGKPAEKADMSAFDKVIPDYVPGYDEIAGCAVKGAEIVKQVPYLIMAEIETARGCPRVPGCSFCTEPLKNKLEFRKIDDILSEVGALHKLGIRHFRLGKQSDFFLWKAADIGRMLRHIRKLDVKTLHIDNIDPMTTAKEKVELVAKYCTEGNVAALGIESFDSKVIAANNLQSSPEQSLNAVRLINRYGSERGDNGVPKFLPGINILFGLKDESKDTHLENMKCLKQILDEGLMLRRINIRQVAAYPGTQLYSDCKDRFIRKNRKYYWKWRNEIRQQIDNPLLKRLVPEGTVLKDVRMEIQDGNNTFGRQLGTYPLIVGVRQRLELEQFYEVKVTGHMLRSITAEVIRKL